jgi:predicted ATPase/DNA-binding winged helix-turn-helix (wHTH) protein
MTIAIPTPRQHSHLGEGPWQRWIDSDLTVEADGRAENPQIRRPSSTEADPIDVSAQGAIAFGPFRLFPTRRLLLEGEKTVHLGSRAFDILISLVERPGELVAKDELMARVWPGTFVEQGNLAVQVAALRRALREGEMGNRYLANIPGRGYRFVAPVTVSQPSQTAAMLRAQIRRLHNLPASITQLVGRTEIIGILSKQFARCRLLTIVGAGGISKTSVALAIAEGLISQYADGVWLIDLASIDDPDLVPGVVASVLGLASCSENQLPYLAAALREKQALLVLDNCAHLIGAAAALAKEVLRGAPGVQILTTSREPMQVEGERIHRLAALASPVAPNGLTAAEALTFPAVQLFIESAATTLDGLRFGDAEAATVAAICRKLDGIPLAIKLAAAQVEVLGLREIEARLDNRIPLLTRGGRGALPKHATITATLDWSYNLLTELERTVFRRLGVFAGEFTPEEARTIAADGAFVASEVDDSVASLISKSLVEASLEGGAVRYRLAETTRAYALEKLSALDN